MSRRKNLSKILAKFQKNHPILTTAASLGTVGGAVASITGLVRELKTAIDEKKRKEELESDGIDPETIVLHVRNKARNGGFSKLSEDESMNCTEEACEQCADPEVCRAQDDSKHDSVTRKQSPVAHETPVGSHETAGIQRDFHGQFTDAGEKIASTGFLTRTAQILAGVGSGAAGYYAVRKLYDKIEQRRLKRQIAAAQKEYLSLLDGSGVKNAEAVNKLLLIGDPLFDGPAEKQAGVIRTMYDALGNQSKNLTATMLASYIMAGIASGWATKRVLESKLDPPEPEEESPKIKRIVFKTYDDDDEKGKSKKQAESFEIEPEAALASIGIMMDCIRDSVDPMSKQAGAEDYKFLKKVTSTPEGRQWVLDMYARGLGLPRDVDTAKMPNLSAMDKLHYASTLGSLRRNPEKHMPHIRGYVKKLMEYNPKEWYGALGNSRNKDLVSRIASQTLRDSLSAGELGSFAQLPGIRHLISGAGSLYFGTDAGRNRAIMSMLKPVEPIRPLFKKTGSDLSMAGIAAMLSRGAVLSDKRNTDLDKKLDMILEKLPNRRKKHQAHKTDVEAEDPEAEGFVVQNGARIAKAVNLLKEKGLLA